jgi:hypothetical protein
LFAVVGEKTAVINREACSEKEIDSIFKTPWTYFYKTPGEQTKKNNTDEKDHFIYAHFA